MKNHHLKLLYNKEQIQERIKELAFKLYEEYKDKNPIFLIVLKGGMFFACDLLRYFPIDFKYQIKTVSASSYKNEISPVQKVDINFAEKKYYDWNSDCVVIIDDVADTFVTLQEIENHLLQRKVKKINTCVLIEKPFRRELSRVPDFFGIVYIDCGFLAGYGMGYDDLYRHCEEIYEVVFE